MPGRVDPSGPKCAFPCCWTGSDGGAALSSGLWSFSTGCQRDRSQRETVLMRAVETGQLQCLEELADAGADFTLMNAEDETHLAATSGQPAVLSRPLRNPALASLLNQASAVCPWGFLLGCVMIAIFTDRVLGSA
eukprot:m.701994 g.701994  ORF g.701994 m.701994 type:complete len:135 (+) comp58712_c0_seq9:437-841(+)